MGAQGTTILNFGAFPGVSDTSVAVAQAAILAGSLVEAWIWPVATADHTADEHMVETFQVFAHSVVAGVGFTISGFNTSQINEQLEFFKGVTSTLAGGLSAPQGFQQPTRGGLGTRIFGQWTIAWVWN